MLKVLGCAMLRITIIFLASVGTKNPDRFCINIIGVLKRAIAVSQSRSTQSD